MAKKKKVNAVPQPQPVPAKLPALTWPGLSKTKTWGIVLFLLGMLVYANTFTHDYAQDDAIVITDNMFTTQGAAGIAGLFKYDTFFGFFKVEGKAKLVSGGRYRPLTPAMFALEYQVFGDSPGAMHVLNALWYGLTVVVLYALLLQLFRIRATWDKRTTPDAVYWIPLLAAVLFAVHPLHTEAVANIKGRDEIMTLLGSLAAVWWLLRPGAVSKVLAGLSFFAALLAKENAITFLAVAPLAFYFFTDKKWPQIAAVLLPLVVATVVFLGIRGAVLGWDFGAQSMELMNNPFLKLENGRWVAFTPGEKAATITYTLGRYAQLLVAPAPLTHDYYPRAVDIMQWSDWRVLLSLLFYGSLLGLAIRGWRQRAVYSFAILYFLLTLSIVSNIVFPVGTNMSERFLFMPSVGFALGLAWVVDGYITNIRVATGVLAALALVFGVLTLQRNPAWKDNFTLFSTDIHTSPNSAKLRNAMAGELSVQWAKLPPEQQAVRTSMLDEALVHINAAIAIHPTYKQAHFIKGNILNYLKQYDAAILAYGEALRIDPDYADADKNRVITYRDAGRYYGEQKGDIATAIRYLEQAYQAMPDEVETVRLLGVANGIAGNTPRAIELFAKNTQLQPDNARAWFDLGTAYINAGQTEAANQAFGKARTIDPDIERKVRSGE